jgi:hypothetical protein
MAKEPANPIRQLIGDKSAELRARYYLAADSAWIKGLVETLPFGGTLNEWFFGNAEKVKQEKIEEFVKDTKERLDVLEKSSIVLDYEYFEKHIEEFAFLFKKTLLAVAEDYRREKISEYVTLTANFWTEKFSQTQNKEIYLNYLIELSPEHLAMLRFIYEYLTVSRGSGLPNLPSDDEKKWRVYEESINKFKTQGVDEGLAEAIFNDLVSRGLVREQIPTGVIGGGNINYYMTKFGTKLLELLDDKLG